MIITAELFYNSIKKKKNWTAPGNDKITNFWIKKLYPLHQKLTEIINNEHSLPAWLQEGRCIMIPKAKTPAAEHHPPLTCLDTLYKAITSVIDGMLKEHEARYQMMQIDQKGCKLGSMGCIDNLLIHKAILEDAQTNKKNITCVWVDVKKAFDSVSHRGLPTKLSTFTKNIMKKWKMTLE